MIRGTIRRRCAVIAALATGMLGLAVPSAHALVTVSDVPSQSWRVNGRVYATAVAGDRIFVGGQFSSAISPQGQSVARRNLAAFSLSTGALLTDWRADAGAAVRALDTDGTSLWVGGSFSSVNGATARRVAKVSVATGAVDRSFSATADSGVRALDEEAGALYVGGAFTTVNGVGRNRLVKVDAATGAVDTGFVAQANDQVWAVAKNPVTSALYVAGRFASINGVARNGVAAVNGTSGAVTNVVFGSAARPTLGLAVSPEGDRLFGAGGSGSNSAVGWRTSDGVRLWRQVTDGDIQAIAYHDGTAYFGFHDGYKQDTSLHLLAANSETGQLQSFYPRSQEFWGIFAITANEDGVVAGGEFTSMSGVPAQGFVRFPLLDAPRPEPVNVSYVNARSRWDYWDADTRPAGWDCRYNSCGVATPHHPGFVSLGWGNGLAQLGYGDGDEATTIGYGGNANDRNLTAYFRTTFTLDEIPDVLNLDVLADDGAVVYVNGEEAVRDNMVLTGSVGHETLARSVRSGGPENALRGYLVDPARLRVGSNVLAIEVHQAGVTSDDLSVDAELVGTYLE